MLYTYLLHIPSSTWNFLCSIPTPSLVASILSSAGRGCVGLRVESQGQRVGLLGTGAGQCPSAGFGSRDPLSERASPEELGDGQRVPSSLAGANKYLWGYKIASFFLRASSFTHDFVLDIGPCVLHA